MERADERSLLEFFDAHAEFVFAHCRLRSPTRAVALSLTKKIFISLFKKGLAGCSPTVLLLEVEQYGAPNTIDFIRPYTEQVR